MSISCVCVWQWVYALDIVLQALGWTGLSTIDPALTAEVVLRLALVFEASASLEASKTAKLGGSRKEEEEEEEATLLSTIRGAHFESASSPRREPGAADNMEEDFPSQSELSQGASRAASSRHSIFSAAVLSQSVHEQLGQARDILELGLGNVSAARTAVALTDGKSIADVIWAKVSLTSRFWSRCSRRCLLFPGAQSGAVSANFCRVL